MRATFQPVLPQASWQPQTFLPQPNRLIAKPTLIRKRSAAHHWENLGKFVVLLTAGWLWQEIVWQWLTR